MRFADEVFCRAVVRGMAAGREIAASAGKLQIQADRCIRRD